MSKKDMKFRTDLMGALKDVRAHKRGEISLASRIVDTPSPKAAMLDRMAMKTLLDISGDAAPPSLSAPLQALWWLKKGSLAMGAEWEMAHAICQTKEGTRDYDLVHALAHWIEGDVGNAEYWYRRVGEKRGSDVAREWTRIVGVLMQ